MVIRPEQMRILALACLNAFEARMAAHLSDRFGSRLGQGSEEDSRAMVREAIARAESHGIIDEWNVQRYLECAAMLGRAFDRDPKYPWAARILDDKTLSSEDKLDQLEEHLTFCLEVRPACPSSNDR